MVDWVEIDFGRAYSIDADTFAVERVKKRASINSIILRKTNTISKRGMSDSNTSFGIVSEKGLVRINKRIASEILSNRAMDYIQRTGQWPPHMSLKRVLISGDVELNFAPMQHDIFALRLSAEMVDGDPFEFLIGLNQYEGQEEVS
ncbi:MAG: hypothetical protein AM324_008950 [Candidatus Thorarchaeota archaeon SMTZ1-83]|nr:MAG: hypothetical protein AM324_10340 [Candidatus Thorarchaeota archaeon SMTZ1-83]